MKAGPAGTGLEFPLRAEEGFAGDDVHIDTSLLIVPVWVTEGRFGACFLGHGVLQRREPTLDFVFGGPLPRLALGGFLIDLSALLGSDRLGLRTRPQGPQNTYAGQRQGRDK